MLYIILYYIIKPTIFSFTSHNVLTERFIQYELQAEEIIQYSVNIYIYMHTVYSNGVDMS